MKQLLLAAFLLSTAAPLFAGDTGGNPGYIPDYQELVREGYGPQNHEQQDYNLRLGFADTQVATPTQAYYGNGYTIYYGYTTVQVAPGQTVYAFGYPAEYFRHLMPDSATGLNLNNYALEVRNSMYAPGEAVARQGAPKHRAAITTVQSTATTAAPATAAGTNLLPAIGEKPPR